MLIYRVTLQEEAIRNIQEAVQCHIEAMLEDGDPIPVEKIGETNVISSAAVVANINRQIEADLQRLKLIN